MAKEVVPGRTAEQEILRLPATEREREELRTPGPAVLGLESAGWRAARELVRQDLPAQAWASRGKLLKVQLATAPIWAQDEAGVSEPVREVAPVEAAVRGKEPVNQPSRVRMRY